MLAGSVVSICTVSSPGCSAAIWSSSPVAAAADDHRVPARLQREREREADAAGGTGDEDVFPEMFMSLVCRNRP